MPVPLKVFDIGHILSHPSNANARKGGNIVKTATVRITPYTTEHDIFAHVDISLIFSWDEGGIKGQSRLVWRLTRDNCVDVSCTPFESTSDLIEQIPATRLQYDSKTHEVTIRYNANPVQGSNALGDGSFGPWSAEVSQICPFIAHGAAIRLVVGNATGLPHALSTVVEEWKAERTSLVHRAYWADPRGPLDYITQNVHPRGTGPTVVWPPQVSYRDLDHFRTSELVGTHREHTFACAHSGHVRLNQRACFLKVTPAGQDNILLMFVHDSEHNPLDIADDEHVAVRIHALNGPDVVEHRWHGSAEPNFPGTHTLDRAFVIRRPYDKEEGCWAGENVSALGKVASFADITAERSAHAILDDSALHYVDLHVTLDQKAAKRWFNNVRFAVDLMCWEMARAPGGSVTADLLLANRFDRLPRLDLLGDMDPSILTRLLEGLGESQRKFILGCRRMPAGVALLQGSAGSGKSHVLLHLLRALAEDKMLKHGDRSDSPRAGLRALVVSPINANAEDLAYKARSLLLHTVPDAIVLRKYARVTERALFERHHNAAREHLRPAAFDPSQAVDELLASTMEAKSFYHEFARRQERVFSRDPRVTAENMPFTPVQMIAYAIELAQRPEVIDRAVARLLLAIPPLSVSNLRDAVDEIRQTETEIPSDQKTTISELINKIMPIVFEQCDALVATVQLAADPDVSRVFHPKLFICDEAAKVTAADSLVWARYPGCHFRLFAGDPMQARPVIKSTVLENEFALQAATSLFVRLRTAGFPTAVLSSQYRYGESIAALLSKVFYGEPIQCADPDAIAQRVVQAISTRDVRTTVLALNVQHTRQEKLATTKSSFNRQTLAHVWKTVDTVKQLGYNDADIAIITPYVAQRVMHESIAFHRHFVAQRTLPSADRTPEHSLLIQTSERAQGLSRPVLIFDLPNSDNLGFAGEATRLCTALSRVQDGLILVADMDAVDTLKGKSKSIHKVLKWCRTQNVVVRANPIPPDDAVFGFFPNTEPRTDRADPTDYVEKEALQVVDGPADDAGEGVRQAEEGPDENGEEGGWQAKEGPAENAEKGGW